MDRIHAARSRRIILVEVSRRDRTLYGNSVLFPWFQDAQDNHPSVLIVANDRADNNRVKCNSV